MSLGEIFNDRHFFFQCNCPVSQSYLSFPLPGVVTPRGKKTSLKSVDGVSGDNCLKNNFHLMGGGYATLRPQFNGL